MPGESSTADRCAAGAGLGAGLRSAPPAALVAADGAGRGRPPGARAGAAAAGRRCSRPSAAGASGPTSAAPAPPPGSATCGSRRSRARRSSRSCALRSSRSSLEGRNGSTEVTLASSERLRGLSRLGSPMMRRATRQRLDEALDGIERALTMRRRPRAVRAHEVVGVGEPGEAGRARPRSAWRCCAPSSARPSPRRASGSRRWSLPAPRPLPAGDRRRRRARRRCSPVASTACAAPPAAATPTWSGCAPGRLDDAPDAVVLPGNAGEVGARARGLRAGGRRRGPVRRRHQRRRRRRAAARRLRVG